MDTIVEKLIKAGKNLESPNYPLLGPNLEGLSMFGLWQNGTTLRNAFYNLIHICSVIFVVTEFVDLYQTRNDLMKALLNLSMTAFSLVAVSKTIFFIAMRSKWEELVNMINEEEISEIRKNEPNTIRLMSGYRKYSRLATYVYWLLILITTIATIVSPGLKYVSTYEYREKIRNGTEPFPQILSSWFPFEENKMPGCVVVTIVHVCITCQGAGVVAAYDAVAITIMTFIKGQAIIVQDKVKNIFGDVTPVSKTEVMKRIIECHRHHNFVKESYNMLNDVLSPVMFIYVLICSFTICCGIVQLTSEDVTSQRLWVTEFIFAQIFQLFMYCWHSNEIALETNAMSRSILESSLWRSDLKERRLLLLLSGKLEPPYILQAGPFTTLSIPTFIDIMKGSYSFYTLFTQMQEDKPN